MFYCVASIRKMSGSGTHEFMMYAKGTTKGEVLAFIFTQGGIILWLEEIGQEDYEILVNAKEKGEFK